MQLIKTLCTVLLKCSKIPHDNVNGYLHQNRLYQTGSRKEKDVKFSKLPNNLKFSYIFPPPKDTNPFYFLDVYKRTGDGKVALWTSNGGKIGVSKFFIKENIEACKKIAEFECARWRELWGVDVFVLNMFDTYVLFMPFVFHIRHYKDMLQFCPMHAWNYRLDRLGHKSSFFSDDIRDDKNIAKIQTKYFDQPLLVAKEALHHMIMECGWMQEDSEVCWDHIGLMPVYRKMKQKWDLKPIMFDLARLKKVKKQDRERVYAEHVHLLENGINKR